tara:strand:+ start:481 stop:1128 length:648 start_codon:yes stop_codon:yes gene_type:complete
MHFNTISVIYVVVIFFLILYLANCEDEDKKILGIPAKLFFNEYWLRSSDFTGKTKRKDFWFALLQTFIIYSLFIGLPVGFYTFFEIYNSFDKVDSLNSLSENITLISWFGAIINFIPQLSLQIRRLNDIGKEKAWILLSFIPFISLILLFWYSKPSYKKRIESDKKDSNLDSSEKTGLNNLEYAEERLEKLKSIFDKGLISNKEYEELRKKTLGL